ncbi:hypothetical protein N878_07605 [Pseudomonas sp. EGD-AK9]|uniref:hypothetical protein n=1 Tax=Pseudomonas sp. EGD-AK9 TaxID=1386078 RepID=UPI0003985C4B|nr:hypothetical protein [Pseudomonas sp. EGD-AK9]ERI50889.1 hypothetical protein N878_07605 [Pseudomonas sp. EGD-AK9]
MYYEVIPLYHLGKKRPRSELQASQRLRVDVQVCVMPVSPIGGPSLCAHIFTAGQFTSDPLPRLYDVRIEGMATMGLVLAGIEEVDGQLYHQAWHCRPLEDQVVIPWTACPRSSLDQLL